MVFWYKDLNESCSFCGYNLGRFIYDFERDEVICPRCYSVIKWGIASIEEWANVKKDRVEKKIYLPFEPIRQKPEDVIEKAINILITREDVARFFEININDLIYWKDYIIEKLKKVAWRETLGQAHFIRFKLLYPEYVQLYSIFSEIKKLLEQLKGKSGRSKNLVEEKLFKINNELYLVRIYLAKSNYIYSEAKSYQVQVLKNGKRIPTYEAPVEIINWLKQKGYLKY